MLTHWYLDKQKPRCRGFLGREEGEEEEEENLFNLI